MLHKPPQSLIITWQHVTTSNQRYTTLLHFQTLQIIQQKVHQQVCTERKLLRTRVLTAQQCLRHPNVRPLILNFNQPSDQPFHAVNSAHTQHGRCIHHVAALLGRQAIGVLQHVLKQN